ncbi:ECF transporter S component [Herbinix luporum]|uniref:ECF transporter S component n=1 Tax=Herbinix luporum TaxID=1679721 RepID=UPI001764AECF|nr:ECF transporter S component [Herbinix luporum]MDI9488435.1 ECF transporter S component [Bacillota bacterium]HHT56599.1 ECF transporter S component [Herbinix luporum]
MNTTVNTKKNQKTSSLMSIRSLIIMTMLGTISVILMKLAIPVWFAPPWYELDLSEVPVLIGAFTLGPIGGIIIEMIKILLNLVIDFTITAGVGETANFLMGCSLVVPAAIIYHRNKTLKSAIKGLIVGTFSMVIIAGLLNAFVLLPTYAYFFKMPVDSLIETGSKINPAIKNMSTMIFYAVTPFNLLKGSLVSIVTLLIYKRIRRAINTIMGI